MKVKALIVVMVSAVLFLTTGTVFAAGDLIVSGNLGVGIQPAAKADVNGDMKVHGNLSVVDAGHGVTFPDNSKQTTAASPSQAITIQNNMTAARTFYPLVYRNYTGKPVYCSVIVHASVLNYEVLAYTDSTPDPTTLVSKVHIIWSGASPDTLNFWVLPGNYYKVVRGSTNVTLVAWTEWY